NATAVRRLAHEAEQVELSPPLLAALAMKLEMLGEDTLPLLRQAQARHPQDFWLNVLLANQLQVRKAPGEALGFYWAGLGIRPDTAAVYNNLGLALYLQRDLKGPIALYHKAIDADPQFVRAYINLSAALAAQKDLQGAIAACRKAIKLDA